MRDVTTFLWVIAAIGAVVFAWVLATALGRLGAEHGAAVLLPDESGESRFELDNERPFNPAAFFVVALALGGIVAAILALSLT